MRLTFMLLEVWIGALFFSAACKEGSDRLFYFSVYIEEFHSSFLLILLAVFVFFLFFFHELGSGFLCVKMQNVRRVHRSQVEEDVKENSNSNSCFAIFFTLSTFGSKLNLEIFD